MPGGRVIDRPRYRFGEFVVSPARRALLRAGREVPLIPRYFDLLVLLIERRGRAVSRREIMDAVWSDVVVSDNALNQAIRIVRRALGDDPRAPAFIKTRARHGYRFIFEGVVEEPDEPGPLAVDVPPPPPAATPDPFHEALRTLLDENVTDDARRDAAETLHALGTEEAVRRLHERRDHPQYQVARAYLRDTRWDVPGAGPVPLLGTPGGVAAFRLLVALRIRRTWQLARRRWAAAIAGGALFGLVAGALGGIALRFGPGSVANTAVLIALPLVGLASGGLGAVGVGAGLAVAEASIRSYRRTALVLLGAAGGGAIGFLAHLLGMAVLEGLFGRDLSPIAGGFEGLAIGGAAGLGYALSAPTTEGGMPTPRGAARLAAVLVTGLFCAVAAGVLGASGRYLGALSLDFMAQSFSGSQVGLDPLARLLGEAHPGPLTKTAISAFEGLMFGAGVALGITRRPR